MSHKKLNIVLEGLMKRYSERVPDVDRIVKSMKDKGLIQSRFDIENDHIAFRTMGVKHLGIKSLEKIFLSCGYTRKDAYQFETKKLDAYWYAPPDPYYPRIFISELRVHDLSEGAQTIIKRYTDEVSSDPVDALDLNNPQDVVNFLHTPLWRTPSYSDYQKLQEESEYAAWVIYNRYYLNHFTISVHQLPVGYNTIEMFNVFLTEIGIKLNNSGGERKVSADGLLIQSSTIAQTVDALFEKNGQEDDIHPISGSYVEFAERRVLPEFQQLLQTEIQRRHRRDGFEAGNADKIFESTYSTQTKIGDDTNN